MHHPLECQPHWEGRILASAIFNRTLSDEERESVMRDMRKMLEPPNIWSRIGGWILNRFARFRRLYLLRTRN